MVCQSCHQQGVRGGQYCSGCGQQVVAQAYAVPQSRIYRAREGKMFAGICAGLSAAYGWDPIVVRLLFVSLVFFGVGLLIPAYFVAWIVIPKAPMFFTTYVPPTPPNDSAQVVA
jgi:phage shock protein C